MGHSNTGHQPGATHEAIPLDPENDIDAKFLSLWVMVPIFLRVQDEEQMKKINNLPNEEYNDVKAHELEFLHGANPQKRSIEDVMAKMASGK
jgi:hypothetical protein